MGIYEYTMMPFGIKNAPAHFQRMMDTIFQEEILEGWMVVYIDDIIIYSETWQDHVKYIDRVLTTIETTSKQFSHITSSLYKLCSKDVVFEITKEIRDAYKRIKYELTNAPVVILPDFELPFKSYIDAACSQGLGAALHQRQIVDGEPRAGKSRKTSEYLSGHQKVGTRKWTPDSGNSDSEGTETPILGINSSELHNEFFNAVMKTYDKHKQCGILLQLHQQMYRSPELESQLEEPLLRDYKENEFFFIDGLLYHREKHTSSLTMIDRDHIYLILQEFHDCPYMEHMSEDRTKERVASTAWWPKWEQEFS
ncbi:hypothetical protein O181_095286 [Austropuccinia psidii MF-1]|uniref:Reverse transcriptase domain-containing protein n=1 Tax=Austropuccinia psidii MF-1 TaxID=1389203 RepID=A0A9Q3J550_9BASI|nr:hypothetical protein [Austropuccinia psidii MF-1]